MDVLDPWKRQRLSAHEQPGDLLGGVVGGAGAAALGTALGCY